MAMETILDRLENRIDEIIKAYDSSNQRAAELEERVAELEQQLQHQSQEGSEAGERISQLESQRDELSTRLEKVLTVIDAALEQSEGEPES